MAITGYFIDSDWVYREVLLGFKPLSGSHTGNHLSEVLLKTLVDHGIQDRIFGLTTDNASNNRTLADSLQQALPDDVTMIRTPCLAHVIQLSLKSLLLCLKVVPKNDTTETRWTDRRSQEAKANSHQRYEVAATLNKIRFLSIYIHASPQRVETFHKLQTDTHLMPIQDVSTRWNSTYLMLRRAKRLREFFNPFCEEYNCLELSLDDAEWRQVDYLLCLTEPFFYYTTALSKTRDITTHLVFKIYNALFEHLEISMTQLKWKRVPWKQQMLRSLEAGRDKLSEYYTQTNSAKRHIYAISTMLSPDNRFQFFLTDDWEKKWRDIYRRSFQEALLPYQERLSEINEGLNISLSPKPQSMFDRLNKPGIGGNQRQSSTGVSEMCQYLDSGMSLISEVFIFHLLTITRYNYR
jgi:hypothetical protein